ncbi:MAG TPA: alpha-L-rhamnosidase C-terminal domain-containing protein, partial [Terriglobia bacterium]|nr:alpha-L-rhamnosidase C-terminal domain-containing protein [Terriglobia bacterium]
PLSDLTSVRASHRSPHGEIVSDWRQENGKFIWGVTIPVNTVATLYVPAINTASITESGRPWKEAPGIRYIGGQDGKAVFEVGSGTYRFVSQMIS